tara:strand:- start:10102 stop:11256 length:1155 start_codon:yes stop_codon:yes gene_type:complete
MLGPQSLQENTVQHSNIVGGSTAKRVINCPGSVVLVQKMPPQGSSKYADEGTLLHDTIADVLHNLTAPEEYLGRAHNQQVLTQDLIDDKLHVALKLLDEVDPNQEMVYEVEQRVGFGDLLPGVFGSTDLIGRIGNRAIVLDWKFGDGVVVTAEENPQLMFYAAAAMRTEESKWAFEGVIEIECIIIQPPVIRRWVTTPARITQFENQLVAAVKTAMKPDAPLATGDHCRWCSAKPICPQMNGAIERETRRVVSLLTPEELGACLTRAEELETYISDLRELAFKTLENNGTVPGYKLVAKRATRQWADEDKAVEFLKAHKVSPHKEPELLSPAQAEKALKKSKVALPDDLVTAVSSGSTLVSESDPRPAVLQIGQQLTAALSKLV